MGYNLPLSSTVNDGDVLPISLYWMTENFVNADYTVALHLFRDNVGVVASAEDSQPGAGFSPTSSWQVSQPVWDNRAIALPSDLPRLEPTVYGYPFMVLIIRAVLKPLTVTGMETAENGAIGVLPVEIVIQRHPP